MLPVFLDEDSMDRALVRGLRASGLDVLTVFEAGRLALPDEEQLVFAASVGRTLYSGNVVDFARLHAEWMRNRRHHCGLVLVSVQRTPVGAQIRALTKLAQTVTPEIMRDRLEFLSNWHD